MTPQEEQVAMQAYVRQRLAAQGRLNLAPGQPPIEDPNAMLQRPPVAPGVGSPAPADQLQLPGVELSGDYATGPRMGVPQGNARAMYRQTVPFAQP
jgi:hypothetical protein